jgi:A/G-specific adenine glycosylase
VRRGARASRPRSPEIATRLAAWFLDHQRPLPWRRGYDPYRVWISEIMLQQTQVDAVLPYFARFMGAFPSLEALASAKEQQVLGLWSGLGYYSRARNLLAAARVVARDHAGELPGDYDALRDLPGIGRYTAGAILSIAFNKPYPIVDGNVRRVLSRVHGWPEAPAERLWEAAAALVLRAEPRLVNQGLMELGATVCSFRAPRCLSCPIQTDCSAFKTGRQAEIPQPRRRLVEDRRWKIGDSR